MSANVLPICDLCAGTTWVSGINGVVRCACWQEKLRTYAPGVPREFHAARLDNYRALAGNQTARTIAAEFLESDRDLFLAGNVGSGKTRLACSLLNEHYATTRTGYFARVPMLLLKLQPQGSDEARAESDALLHRLMTEPLIVLDDVGAERDAGTDFTRRTLLTIYEERGDKGHRTIWTSNLPLAPVPGTKQTLGQFMGDDRLASRIAGRCEAVWVSTSDQRLAQARAVGDR